MLNTFQHAVLLLVPVAALLARWVGGDSGYGPGFFPVPDSLEYAASAQSIADSGRYFLQVGPHPVPPRYSPGWPLVLAGALRAGVPPIELWRISGVFGALAAWILSLAIARSLVGNASDRKEKWIAVGCGVLGGLAWSFSPLANRVGQTLLSDEATVAVQLLALALLVTGARSNAPFPALFAAGVCFGLAFAMRPIAGALLLVPVGLWALARILQPNPRNRAGIVVLAMGLLVPVSATLWLLSRSSLPLWPWGAYAFWVPEWHDSLSTTFQLRFALVGNEAFPARLGGAPVSHLHYGFATLLGLPGLPPRTLHGTLWPLIGWTGGLWMLRRQALRQVFPWVLWVLLTVGIFALYFYPDARFHLGLLALVTFLSVRTIGLLALQRRRAAQVFGGFLGLFLVLNLVRDFATYRDRTPVVRDSNRGVAESVAGWLDLPDSKRRNLQIPFDPVRAQALGLLDSARIRGVESWGRLPETDHVLRLRKNGQIAR